MSRPFEYSCKFISVAPKSQSQFRFKEAHTKPSANPQSALDAHGTQQTGKIGACHPAQDQSTQVCASGFACFPGQEAAVLFILLCLRRRLSGTVRRRVIDATHETAIPRSLYLGSSLTYFTVSLSFLLLLNWSSALSQARVDAL